MTHLRGRPRPGGSARPDSGCRGTSPSPIGPCCWRRGPRAAPGSGGLSNGSDVAHTLPAVRSLRRRHHAAALRRGRRRRGRRAAGGARRADRCRQLREPPSGSWPVGRPPSTASRCCPATPRSPAGPWTGSPIPLRGHGRPHRRPPGRSAAAARRPRRRPAGHRLPPPCAQRPGQGGRAAGRPGRGGGDDRARGRPDPGPHRGAAEVVRSRHPCPRRGRDRPPLSPAAVRPGRAGRPVPGRLLDRGRVHHPRKRPGHRARLRGPRAGRLPRRAPAHGGRHRRSVDLDPATRTASITARYGPLPGHRTSAAPRSRPSSTRFPSWPLPPRPQRGPPPSPTPPSSRSRRATASPPWSPPCRPLAPQAEARPGRPGRARPGSGEPLAGGQVDSAGDHRVAMALAVAALAAAAPDPHRRMGRRRHQLPHFRGGLPAVRVPSVSSPSTGPPGPGKSTVARAVAGPAGPRLSRHRGHVPGGGLRGHAAAASTPTTPTRWPSWPARSISRWATPSSWTAWTPPSRFAAPK